jgi:hypothetical protein
MPPTPNEEVPMSPHAQIDERDRPIDDGAALTDADLDATLDQRFCGSFPPYC